MKVTVLAGQSLVDVAIQVYGSAEGVVVLAKDNGMEVTDVPTPGRQLEYSTDNIVAKNIAQYYSSKKVCPATGTPFDPSAGVWDGLFDLTFK